MAVILLVLAPMVAVVLLLKVMMLVMLRNLHLDFPSRRMRSTPLGVVLIFVTCFFRAERARERIEFAFSGGSNICWRRQMQMGTWLMRAMIDLIKFYPCFIHIYLKKGSTTNPVEI